MSKLKLIKAKEMEKILFYLGFEKSRQKGSHAFYKHHDGRRTTIPHHGNRILARPLIRIILKEIEVSVDDYNNYLKTI